MKKARDYEVLAPLLSAQLRRGVQTNCFLSAEEYRCEIATGALSYEAWAGGLLLLLQRGGYTKALWFLTDTSQKLPCALPEPVVMELASKPNVEGLDALDFWVREGFAPRFKRLRMCKPAGELPPAVGTVLAGVTLNTHTSCADSFAVRTCGGADFDAISALLAAHYHPYYGCLPQEKELADLLCAGEISCAVGQDGALLAMLHIASGKHYFELRHLATAPQQRGRGAASALLGARIAGKGGQKSLVWTGETNCAAQRLFTQFGYVADGWTSTVLSNERN